MRDSVHLSSFKNYTQPVDEPTLSTLIHSAVEQEIIRNKSRNTPASHIPRSSGNNTLLSGAVRPSNISIQRVQDLRRTNLSNVIS